jgi:hypothetical protein
MSTADLLRTLSRLHPRDCWAVAKPAVAGMLACCLAMGFVADAPAAPPTQQDTAALHDRFVAMQLLFCFQGKGSCLPYDAGVLHEAFARIDAFREGRVIVAGNSSGAIPAAFFGCHGFSKATVRHAEDRLQHGNRDAVRTMENVSAKIAKLSRGESTEIEHDDLREFIAFALGVTRWQDAGSIDEVVRRSTARPRFPCLIVACNKEVLDDVHPEDRFAAGRLKELDLDTMQVSWRPEVHAYYRQHPDRFRREHPELVLGEEPVIGRAMTFFVDQSMYDLLSQIPAHERQADLRLMTTAADVALAILASASEPTYFPVVVDPEPAKILPADAADVHDLVQQRTYYGGYIVSMPAQDVRRMLPAIHVLGTGWRHNPLVARRLLASWLLADCEQVAQRAEWWCDMEINPDREFESYIENRTLTGPEEYAFGLRRTRELFADGGGLPAFVQAPAFERPAAAAIIPAGDAANRDAILAAPLHTLRGLGPLLTR